MKTLSLNKWMQRGVVVVLLAMQQILCATERQDFLNVRQVENAEHLSKRQNELIAHVQQSIAKAERGVSKLSEPTLRVPGMSSAKVRHLLNNLCSLPKTSYLEIGCWLGSTWIAGLYGNQESMASAIAIDNWSQFSGSAKRFYDNCNEFLRNYKYRLYSDDCFKVNLTAIFNQPISIYFYDGDHTPLAQELAFTYYNAVFDDVFIAIVDDWNWDCVKEGTRTAFEKLQYEILFETELPARFNQDTQNWWNGLYVAVIRKPVLN